MMITVATIWFIYTHRGFEMTTELTSAFRERKDAKNWVNDIEARKLEAYQKEADTYFPGAFHFTADDFKLESFSLRDLHLN